MKKIFALESLRGLAALAVVFHHFALAFYPAMVFGQSSADEQSIYEQYVLQTPLNVLINGKVAVIIFFVLSGFVLSYGFFIKMSDLVIATVKRYFRLAPIVLAAVLLSYVVMKYGLYSNLEVSNITNSVWLKEQWPHEVGLLDAFWQGIFGVFGSSGSLSTSLNSALWTIKYEFMGSLIVYSFLALAGKSKNRWIMYLIYMFAFGSGYFGAFVLGVILCDTFVHRQDIYDKLGSMKRGYKVLFLTSAIVAAAFPRDILKIEDYNITQKAIMLFPNDIEQSSQLLYFYASVVFILLILTSRKMREFLEREPFVMFGGLSYSLYAIHMILLGSLGCGVFLIFSRYMLYNYATAATFAVLIPSIIGLSYLFRKYIDLPSISLSRRIGEAISKKIVSKQGAKDVEEML